MSDAIIFSINFYIRIKQFQLYASVCMNKILSFSFDKKYLLAQVLGWVWDMNQCGCKNYFLQSIVLFCHNFYSNNEWQIRANIQCLAFLKLHFTYVDIGSHQALLQSKFAVAAVEQVKKRLPEQRIDCISKSRIIIRRAKNKFKDDKRAQLHKIKHKLFVFRLQINTGIWKLQFV